MLKRPLYTGCADWSTSEFLSVLGSVASGHVVSGNNITTLSQTFKDRYQSAGAFAVNSGRTAIRLILEALQKRAPGKSEVIIPAYICPSLPMAVVASRLRPVSVDIEADLNVSPATVAAAIDGNTLAVVVPHMYGCPAQISRMEELCAARGIFLIDDAAQVVGVAVGGRTLGSFGAFGVISFAQSKAIVAGLSGAGGMLLVNDHSFLKCIEPSIQALPCPSRRFRAYMQFAGDYLLDPLSHELAYYFLRALKALGLESAPDILPAARISNFEAGIALCQLTRLGEVLSEKRRVVNLYQKHLGSAPGFEFPQYAAGRFLSRIMLRVPAGDAAERVWRQLKARHIQIRRGYPTFISGLGPTPNALLASTRLIEAPFYRGIKEASIHQFCKTLAAVAP